MTGVSVAQIRADIANKQARHNARVASKNERYRVALLNVTKIQAEKVAALKQGGAVLQNGIRQDRRTGNIAMFLHKKTWDGAKGRVGCKLYAVYPDGSVSETFEKSISVKSSF